MAKTHRLFLLLGPWLSLTLGCQEAAPPTPAAPPTELGARFDAAAAGTIQGQVRWEGALPDVPPYHTRVHPLAGLGLRERLVRENPNAPQIDLTGRGVANAVVYLRGIDHERSRPWDWPPVRVEMRDRRLLIVQGGREGRVGVVRRGAAVTMVSKDVFFHALHAGQAAYFSLMFPEADQPLERPLKGKGLVEWSSASGYYWMRAYTFVDEHPYYALTNAAGHFALPQVPPGTYDVVCWLPNWQVERKEVDPDMAITWRLIYRKGAEQARTIRLNPQSTKMLDFTVSPRDFE
jgi:hypothetical protein